MRMRPVVAVLAALVLSCSESHEGGPGATVDGATDAGRADAAVGRDANPDATRCEDADGDGHLAFGCGGHDCDDSNPMIGDSSRRCASPSSVSVCSRGEWQDEECGEDTPDCDARHGACVETGSACGDGVVHPAEECDDGNLVVGDGCAHGCVLEACRASSECPAGELCSYRASDGRILCRAPIAAARDTGARCLEDDDCASGWCDHDQGRCTESCVANADCGGALSWCTAEVPTVDTGVCAVSCLGEADCPDGFRCAWNERTYCTRSVGEATLGEACSRESECDGVACIYRACTYICVSDEGCPLDGWHCDLTSPIAAPPGWPVDSFSFCVPDEWGRDES